MLTSTPKGLASGLSDGSEGRLPTVLRQALGIHWDFTISDGRIMVEHVHRGSPYHPPRRSPSWEELLEGLKAGFAAQGVPQDTCLPLRWGRETELTISAVQALDPLLKDGRPLTYRSGFLPQPVVRFTGQRDASGDLRDGFLTSFVNVSRIQQIQGMDEYGEILDGWLSVLSRLGFHARHVSARGKLATWRRGQVAGVTLHFSHLDMPIGDIVLLWNVDNPRLMAVDLGTGLERLAWARTRSDWLDLIFGKSVPLACPRTLDAIRTATLLLAHGIRPAARGAGGITRRVIGSVDPGSARLGVSALVRASYRYWRLFGEPEVPWPAVAVAIEEELGV
ncbi:hypothetical protein AB0D11_25395 [Streptomyces monashensis]|uniref:hypothetical protein n=1 Tax=Streptomyces monashensis TaxID=1678012 RepID=UPI0033E9D885